ncbi:MAG TPA: cytochrome c [Steroidobacteraceae bacterium]|nr:cytochrome c [Steroidobacteraceae bacterium]
MTIAKLRIAAGALALLGFAAAASNAAALSAPEKRGRVLATRLCAQCHAIGKADTSQRPGAIPFRRLSQRVNLDTFASRLRQGLMSGHHEMPEFRFSREDSHAMVAYLRSIQGP